MNNKRKAIEILLNNGYEIKGDTVKAPDTNSPLEAISIQHELNEFGYRIMYIGDKLKLINEKL